jgi:aryl-alcohol dehydrogenase-like predicted oxidoreductase
MMAEETGTGDMPFSRRRLGRTGLEVTALGMGGAGIGGRNVSDADAIDAVSLALERGINFLDTSPLYGESERRMGLALAGVPRDRYYLSTKTGTHPERRHDYSRDATLWSVENSRRLLGVDYFDLVLIHDPRDENDMTAIFGQGGVLETLEELRGQGVLRFIGLGQRRHDWHRRAMESGRFDVILTYNDFHPVRTTALTGGLLDAAQAADVGVLNGSPMANGLLVGTDPDTHRERSPHSGTREWEAARRLYRFCQERAVPMAAVVLQYSLRQPRIACTLTGASTAAEVARNLEAASHPVPPQLWAELDALNLTAGQTQPGEEIRG